MIITHPTALAPCRCLQNTGEVCVKGTGAKNGDEVVASLVYAKIYQPPNQPADPLDGPPGGAAVCTPNANGDWCIGYLGGAICSVASPYTQNSVWVWAKYVVGGVVSYEPLAKVFNGQCQMNLPECCGSSSSSSSSSSGG